MSVYTCTCTHVRTRTRIYFKFDKTKQISVTECIESDVTQFSLKVSRFTALTAIYGLHPASIVLATESTRYPLIPKSHIFTCPCVLISTLEGLTSAKEITEECHCLQALLFFFLLEIMVKREAGCNMGCHQQRAPKAMHDLFVGLK